MGTLRFLRFPTITSGKAVSRLLNLAELNFSDHEKSFFQSQKII